MLWFNISLGQESVFRKFSSTCNFLKFIVRFCIQFSILQSTSLNHSISLSWSADSASSVRSFLAFFSSIFIRCCRSFSCMLRMSRGLGIQLAREIPLCQLQLLNHFLHCFTGELSGPWAPQVWLPMLEASPDMVQLQPEITLLGKSWVRDDALLRLPFTQHKAQTFSLAPDLGSLNPAWLCPSLTLNSVCFTLDCLVPMDLSGNWDWGWGWSWLFSPTCSAGPMQVPGTSGCHPGTALHPVWSSLPLQVPGKKSQEKSVIQV